MFPGTKQGYFPFTKQGGIDRNFIPVKFNTFKENVLQVVRSVMFFYKSFYMYYNND